MKKTIITVVGKDSIGIIAKVCTYLADKNVNILDISQTIVQGFFNMMMITDMTECSVGFEEVSNQLEELGKELGVTIKAQREEIFEKMHRL
ncbi:MAG: ACT domain-containing protein [Lachnospiraceae bacterium]|nr:ACT domain-containing protein [Lachnospiraceae bacterium]